MARDWGRVLVGTRLEKQVSSRFFQVWSNLILRGIAQGDGVLSVRGKVAHKAANDLVRQFLTTECDSLLFVDSDAVVDADIVEQFRRYEPGYTFDALQAFYCRRGWPPSAIWMKRNALGQMTDIFVTEDNWLDEVDIVGLHCTMVRREVFETMLGDEDPATFEWFFYPRHQTDSEDGAFSLEAKALGFRLGATTAIKAGHLSELPTTWETYNDWLNLTGQRSLIERWRELAGMVAGFTEEPVDLVVAKSLDGTELVRDAWLRAQPRTADEVKAFYGDPENGYLYDLVWWNCQPQYERVIAPLYEIAGRKALVIGAGLGTEVQILRAGGNAVDVYELPGVLREFLIQRFDGRGVSILDWLPEGRGQYGVVAAVDVLEHVHPNEIAEMLLRIEGLLAKGGTLVMHATWGSGERFPQHYDHRTLVEPWLERFERIGESEWRKN